jgi:hypothetical protein
LVSFGYSHLFCFLHGLALKYILYMDSCFQKPRTLPGLAPLHFACNNTLYYYTINHALPAIDTIIKTNPVPFSCLSHGVQVIIKLVLLNSMRVTELLQITSSDEIKPSMFISRGLKKSNSYLVHIPIDPYNRRILDKLPERTPLFQWSYNQVYRAMCNAGLPLCITTRVNRCVTHRGRYDLAQKLEALNDTANVTPLLHHKSSTSAAYYLRAFGNKKGAGA